LAAPLKGVRFNDWRIMLANTCRSKPLDLEIVNYMFKITIDKKCAAIDSNCMTQWMRRTQSKERVSTV